MSSTPACEFIDHTFDIVVVGAGMVEFCKSRSIAISLRQSRNELEITAAAIVVLASERCNEIAMNWVKRP